MFMICELHKVGSMTSLDNTKGSEGQIVEDNSTGNLYIKHAGTWQQIATPSATGKQQAVSLAIAVKNSAGGITRNLTETNGVVTLAATDTIVANGDAAVLKNHSGTVSSGNAGLNSAGSVANVAAGVLGAVTAGA